MTKQVQAVPPSEGAPAPTDDPTPVDQWALLALALSTLMPSLATSSANVALPTLSMTFGASFHAVQWVVLAYLLALTSVIVGVGRLGDLYGRQRTLQAGLAVYVLASIAGGLATGLEAVIVARAAQGLGAAVMMALSLALVGEVVPKARMGSAMGVMGTTSAIGTALGPTVGGLLLGWAGWRAIFFVHVPLGLLTLYLVRHHLPDPAAQASTPTARFDHVGMFVLASTLTLYALGVTAGPGNLGGVHMGLVVASVLGAALFAVVEVRAAAPLIRPAMLLDAVFGSSLAASALVATVVMTTMVVGPFYLYRALGMDARTVGLVMSVGPLVAALTGVPAGRVVDRFGSRRATLVGLGAMVAGTSLLAATPESFRVSGYVPPIAVLTSGYALFQTANNTAVMKGVSDAQRGVVAAMLNLSRNLGLITGASVMGTVFVSATGTTELMTAPPAHVAIGMRTAFGVATALVALALWVALPSRATAARRSHRVAGVWALLVAGWGVGDAAAAELVTPDRAPAAASTVQVGDAGVWGGQALSVDLRRPGTAVGAFVSFDLAERTMGATWHGTARPGLGIVGRVGRTDLSASFGYGVVVGRGQDAPWQVEHRLWQSVQADTRLTAHRPARVTARLRLEERDLPGGDAFQVRLRVLARGLIPTGRSGWGVSAWDEVFVRLNSVGGVAGFDQNRAFVGPYFQSATGVRAEVGYLNVLVDKLDGATGGHVWIANHAALLQLTVGAKAFRRVEVGRG